MRSFNKEPRRKSPFWYKTSIPFYLFVQKSIAKERTFLCENQRFDLNQAAAPVRRCYEFSLEQMKTAHQAKKIKKNVKNNNNMASILSPLSDSDATSSKQQSSEKVTATATACFNVIPLASSIACYGPKLN